MDIVTLTVKTDVEELDTVCHALGAFAREYVRIAETAERDGLIADAGAARYGAAQIAFMAARFRKLTARAENRR